MPSPRFVTALSIAVLVSLAIGCGGGEETPDDAGGGRALTVWILESEPDRVRATRANVGRFARATGFKVDLIGVGDDQLAQRMTEAVRTRRLPDVVQLPVASAHAYARDGIVSSNAAQEVVDRLGEETFSARALSLLTSEGTVTAVPSDGWGQLLIYRKDLFDEAGLRAPRTLNDIRRAARRLHGGELAGITLATAPSPFAAETFEHVALAAGCHLLDDRGNVTLTSPQCEYAFEVYADLARNYSVRGSQDVDSTRATYFAGRAAMIFWSPFLLDAMAGLRDDAVPTCPQCRTDAAYLARNSGLVGPLAGPGGEPAQYGTVSTWGITTDADIEGAQRFVAYMMSEGYLRWLALSPQGKYPVRFGDRSDPERYVNGWAGLRSGVDRKAPLSRFYSEKSIESIGDGARNFQRWGFEQGGAALVGAMRGPEPIAKALASAISDGTDAARAARQAQAAVEALDRSID
jgi:multiple sugar transport system substrate-binding protein